jgi:cellulose synthase/poly-beta-1,6-N-acetylglucosamine synthase-like glycosyltransferase
MKGPFSIWTFFGLTLWIDLASLIFYSGRKDKRVNPYKPLKSLSVIIPAFREEEHIADTIKSIYAENFPVKNVVVCGDAYSSDMGLIVDKLAAKYPGLMYLVCPKASKAEKINYAIGNMRNILGDFIYVRDARVFGKKDTMERMMSCFTSSKVAAVTSYGRLSAPKNFLSRAYYYGKSWINEIGRFRKGAQEKRRAMFVICGASTIYRKAVLESFPLVPKSKTEDTYYTWLLQRKGFELRVADDAVVSAPEVDGKGFSGLKAQLKQAYRWSSGTMQCFYLESEVMEKNKRLFLTTVLPGFLEATMYSIALILSPLVLMLSLEVGMGFIIGDTVFSLIGTAILLPKKFFKTLVHYPEIFFFKYLNSIVYLAALMHTTGEALHANPNWKNEWIPPQTGKAKPNAQGKIDKLLNHSFVNEA